MTAKLVIVSDFDGTFTAKDVGNELCIAVIPELFKRLHSEYRTGTLNLKNYQKQLWRAFPLTEPRFREMAVGFGKLRPGVEDFLTVCARAFVPVYIASCGLRPYIEEVLDHALSPEARASIRDIRCNEADWAGQNQITTFTPPVSSDDCPYPLDKGAWAAEVAAPHRAPGTVVVGLGNGTSDRSFKGHVDLLFATESLAKWCESSGTPHVYFDDFRDVSRELAARKLL